MTRVSVGDIARGGRPCPDSFLSLAHQLADASGQVIRPLFRSAIPIDLKEDHSPVTRADQDAESAIRSVLTRERPDDGVIGEEHGIDHAEREFVWVIDPIDGTRAFITGKPMFGTLIALLQNGRPILGLIDQPVLGDRWVGAVGHATLFNGREARVRPCRDLSAAHLNATSPEMFEGEERRAFDRLSAAAGFTHYGGDCYAYGLLASGFLDLVVEAGLKTHDFCALAPVVIGAGGSMTDWQGADLTLASEGQVIASGDPGCHRLATRILAPPEASGA